MGYYAYNNELCHFGIKGQKWGIRRYQNKDGSLTSEGQKHYNAYQTAKKKSDRTYQEADKLIKSDKRLKRDFGKASNIDDMDLFDLSLQEYKISGKDFYEAKKDEYLYRKENAASIAEGRKIYNKLHK